MSSVSQLAGTYVCAKPKVYVPDCGALTLVVDSALGTFAITSEDGTLEDRGKLAVADDLITLTISGAEDDPMAFSYRLVPHGLELSMGGKTDVWVRK